MAASSFFSYGFSYADGEHGKDILISYLDGNPFAGTTQITATRVPHLTYSETGTSSTFIALPELDHGFSTIRDSATPVNSMLHFGSLREKGIGIFASRCSTCISAVVFAYKLVGRPN